MSHPGTGPAPPPEAVGPLIRGLAVLRVLSAAGGRLSAGELARATGLARSTVDRALSTFDRLGLLRAEGRDAVLAPPLMELGNAYLAASRLPRLLGPLADRLAAELDESVSLAVPDGDGARFVHQAVRRRSVSLAFRVGDLVPAERGAPGALFASAWTHDEWEQWRRRRAADPTDSGFPAVPAGDGGDHAFAERVALAAERGWAADGELIEPGLIAVAVPVHDACGLQVCALSVVSHTSRHDTDSLAAAVLPRLRETAQRMERALAAPTPPAAGAPAPAAATAANRASKQELGPEFVESLARGIAVLTVFGEGREALPLTTVAEASGLPRATARRALFTLRHLGYVAADGSLFRPTPRVLELGFAALSGLTLPGIARHHLAELVELVHDSASMAVLDGDDIRYVARVPTVRIMRVDITVGTRFPAYATAMGRVLYAGLPEEERGPRLAGIRLDPLTPHTVTAPERLAALVEETGRQGHALVNDELEEGLRSLAVPVHDPAGRVVAAVNISMHSARRTPEQALDELLPPLRRTARHIEGDLRVAGRFTAVPLS
ncbi:IclR family transcriptional regulator domain-containing protein [Streptomyces meridianus]|uniref:Helix-turn-helix domain-containing protein n=1 Tax=Streptomyces meridianus TaxID=2938945 RepID=A0ABT0X4U2_9ACTN|nr:IclR family transcriptional regulator C-terminal domain-containing protein [Streptomyces meridianus]MCM2577439.1 helix-turn-helix domain-containing protein [Streptomyces meridianus]